MTPRIQVVQTPAALAEEAASFVVNEAARAIDENGAFAIGLAGGTTPKKLYRQLAGEPFKSQIDWTRVEVFFGDERCVPPDHDDSNYRMARETLLTKVPIPGDNIYRIRAETVPQEAAAEYEELLRERFGDEGGFDLNLLGMGGDGHTASLFPNTSALDVDDALCVANRVEKLDTTRLTLTVPFLNRSRSTLVLVTGQSKATTVAAVLEGDRDPKRLPIQLIQPHSGALTWLLDAAAAGMTGQ